MLSSALWLPLTRVRSTTAFRLLTVLCDASGEQSYCLGLTEVSSDLSNQEMAPKNIIGTFIFVGVKVKIAV
jgi:hypothetical protein